MKSASLFLVFGISCLFLSCRENQNIDPGACENLRPDVSQLEPQWQLTGNYTNSIYPTVFERQVIFSRLQNEQESELLSFDGESGQVLWKSSVPVPYLAEGGYQQLGSKLYFSGEYYTSLFSFDLASQQIVSLWTLPEQGYMSSYFTVLGDFAICPVNFYVPDSDSADLSAYLIDLRSGVSREILRFRALPADFIDSGILDPQATLASNGDTVFCFVRASSDPFSARFVSVNISTGTVTESEAVAELYRADRGNLVVQENHAWFLAGNQLKCYDVLSGKEIWQHSDADLEGNQLIVTAGKVMLFGNSRRAFDPATGAQTWSVSPNGYRERKHVKFVQGGQLYLIQDFHLQSIDLETGCLTGDHALPAGTDVGLDNMALSQDAQTLYILGYKNFMATPLPK